MCVKLGHEKMQEFSYKFKDPEQLEQLLELFWQLEQELLQATSVPLLSK